MVINWLTSYWTPGDIIAGIGKAFASLDPNKRTHQVLALGLLMLLVWVPLAAIWAFARWQIATHALASLEASSKPDNLASVNYTSIGVAVIAVAIAAVLLLTCLVLLFRWRKERGVSRRLQQELNTATQLASAKDTEVQVLQSAKQRVRELDSEIENWKNYLTEYMQSAVDLSAQLRVMAHAASANDRETAFIQLCSQIAVYLFEEPYYGGAHSGKMAFVHIPGTIPVTAPWGMPRMSPSRLEEFSQNVVNFPIVQEAIHDGQLKYLDDTTTHQSSMIRAPRTNITVQNCGSIMVVPVIGSNGEQGVIALYAEGANYFKGRRAEYIPNYLRYAMEIALKLRQTNSHNNP